MKKGAACTLCLLAILAGCSKPRLDVAVSVASVHENVSNWDDRIVTVEGWLGRCGGNECAIYPSLADARQTAGGNMSTKAELNAMNRGLSIGFEEKFDADATPLQFRKVKLTARINDECYPANCKDRADILQPISIRPSPLNKDK